MRALLTPLAMLALSTMGCAADDSSVLTSRLQECGILSAGEIGTGVTRLFYAPDACYRDCLSSATCEDLSAALCNTSIALLRGCDERCAYRCPDDSLIAIERVCDGFPQCEGGADEEGCPTFTCRDGSTVVGRAECNGARDCSDGSDETDCPGAFSCRTAWGESVGTWERCNGYVACDDGSDERDCPAHTCADGGEITIRPGVSLRCDGYTQCFDASDEQGCATLDATTCDAR